MTINVFLQRARQPDRPPIAQHPQSDGQVRNQVLNLEQQRRTLEPRQQMPGQSGLQRG